MYKVVRDFAQFSDTDLVYDLYTGTGTIANFVARDVKKVIGIEYVEEAIEDARFNSKANDIDNTLFFAGDMKDILNKALVANADTDAVAKVIDAVVNTPRQDVQPKTDKEAAIKRSLAVEEALAKRYKALRITAIDIITDTYTSSNV